MLTISIQPENLFYNYLIKFNQTTNYKPKLKSLFKIPYRPKFRSYKPQDEMLQEAKLEEAQPTLVEDEVKDLLEAGKEKVCFH